MPQHLFRTIRRFGTRRALGTLAAAMLAVGGLVAATGLVPAAQRASPAAMTGAAPAASTTPAAPATSSRAASEAGPSSRITPPPTSRVRNPERKGTRFADRIFRVAGWLNIPKRAMRAYASATVVLQHRQPDCDLSWVTLAGIGAIASDHGRIGGRELTPRGVVSSPIGTIEVRDFAGNLVSVNGAAGPLQLGPAVWDRWAASASGGEPNIQDIDDAALTAARALCAGERDLGTSEGWLSAVSSLQQAPLYVHRVLATATVYGTVAQNPEPPDPDALGAVMFAINKIGLPYVWGGDGRRAGDAGFDCSGLTKAAYASVGITIPRTAHAQYEAVPRIPQGTKPRLGDLIFYGTPEYIHHVGIYIGNGQMIDAPTFGQAVQVHRYRTPGDDFVSAGRPTAP